MQVVTVQGQAAATPEEALGLAVLNNQAIAEGAEDFMVMPGGIAKLDDGYVATVQFVLMSEDDLPLLQEMRRKARQLNSDFGQDQDQLSSGDMSDETHENIENERRGMAVDSEMHGFEAVGHLIVHNEEIYEQARNDIDEQEKEDLGDELDHDFEEASADPYSSSLDSVPTENIITTRLDGRTIEVSSTQDLLASQDVALTRPGDDSPQQVASFEKTAEANGQAIGPAPGLGGGGEKGGEKSSSAT